ncbi:MAG: hypothetical protein Q8J64_08015 [Thermodesulfovibrionales bacterium]|nr:hypothetical protein [Thermodesulfovibrionales bacterium]
MEEQRQEEQRRIGLDLSTASKDVIDVLLDEADDPSVFEEVERVNKDRSEILRLLYEHPRTPDNVRESVAKFLHLPVIVSRELEEIKKRELAKSKEVRGQSVAQKVQKLGVSDRIRLAIRGGREIRSLLLKDTNKEVVLTVLDNPKLTETEVEMIARSRNVPDEALRIVARNREWMKNYSILLALITNPKTPAGIAVGFISSLKKKDLSLLEKNKNVPEVIRAAARRLISASRKQ